MPLQTPNTITIATLEVELHTEYKTVAKSDVPQYMLLEMNGLNISLDDLSSHYKKTLADIGYTGLISLNAVVDYTYEKENKTLDIEEISFGGDDIGEVRISMSLGNIDLDSGGISKLLFSYNSIVLNNISLTYDDDSLIDRILNVEAKKEGVDIEEFRENLVETMTKAAEGKEVEAHKDSMMILVGFVDSPDVLTISMNPKEGTTIGDIFAAQRRGPIAIAELTNIKLSN